MWEQYSFENDLTIYRVVATELGRPLLINDNDYDVSEPVPVDDECIRPNGIVMPAPGQMPANGLLAIIPVTRTTAQLKKTLKSQTIAAATLATCDEHFKSIMASMPEPFQIHSQAPLDPRLLTAGSSLQTQMFFLYRHNLSPACRMNDRTDALARCVSVAKDTAHYVQRTMQHPSTSPNQGYMSPSHLASWAARIRTMAPAFFCAHLWRCQLVLCLTGEFAAALTLTHVSAAVGEVRKNNIACGRYLAFFLDKLIEKLRAGMGQEQLATDEELLAYASGDMQGCADDAWAWYGSETGMNLAQAQVVKDGYPGDKPALSAEQLSTSTLSEQESRDWGGWDHIQRTLSQLQEHQQARPSSQAQQRTPAPAASMAGQPSPYPPPPTQHHLAPSPYPSQPPSYAPSPNPHSVESSNGSGNGSNTGGGSSRISIKDIM